VHCLLHLFLEEFSKWKFQVLHLGKNNSRHRYTMGADWLERRFAEKELVILPGGHQVEHELTMCPCGKKGKWYPTLAGVLPAGQERQPFLSAQHW